jgi:Zn-dependent protease with chaperone function
MTSMIKTGVLMAGLTALLMVAGQALGGHGGMMTNGLMRILTLFSTHPPIQKRISRLLAACR